MPIGWWGCGCVCIATDSQVGGIYRSTDALTWTSNNGTEFLSPLVHCDGTFVGYDFFNDQQLYSADGWPDLERRRSVRRRLRDHRLLLSSHLAASTFTDGPIAGSKRRS